MAVNNRYIGQVILHDIEPGPAGVKTYLKMQLDESGVLNVSGHKNNKMAMVDVFLILY